MKKPLHFHFYQTLVVIATYLPLSRGSAQHAERSTHGRRPQYVSSFTTEDPGCLGETDQLLHTALHPVPFQFTDEDDAPATLPETGQAGEQSKIKMILGLLKK